MTDSIMSAEHYVEINKRNSLLVSGISSVNSFDDVQIYVTLHNDEVLVIEGSNLDIKEVNLQKGLLEATGMISGLYYEESSDKHKSISFLKSLFTRS